MGEGEQEQLVAQDSPSDAELEMSAQLSWRDGPGRWTMILKTEYIPPRRREVDLKTVPQGNATRELYKLYSPQGQTPQSKGKAGSLPVYHFPQWFSRHPNLGSYKTETWAGQLRERE